MISHVNPHTKTPIYGVWMAAGAALILGLLAFAGSAAIAAVFALVVAGQNIAWSIPILARVITRKNFESGPFSLGVLVSVPIRSFFARVAKLPSQSVPIALIAVAWMSFMTAIVMFPTSPSPAADDMNYTAVVLGGVLIGAVIYYYFPKYGGVYWFRGPLRNIDTEAVRMLEEKSGVKLRSESAGYLSTGSR